jgi:hypothetical protein
MRQRAKQGGLTIWGFLFVAAVVVIFGVVGFRVTPAYIEYFAVQKALVRRAFERRADAGYIESVRASDVVVTKDGNRITASASWNRTLPLVANASILLEFEAIASR